MLRHASWYAGMLLLSGTLGLTGCGEDGPSAPVAPEANESPVKAIVVRSAGSDFPLFWEHLEDWSDVGERIIIDYTTFNHQSITSNGLAESGADVVIIDDARNRLAGQILTSQEIDALMAYVLAGHGLIVTGGTLKPAEHWNLISLLGYSENIGGGVYFGAVAPDSIAIAEEHGDLLAELETFATASHEFHSGGDWDGDGVLSQPEDWQAVFNSPHGRIIGYVWNVNHLTDQPQCGPISYVDNPLYRSVFAAFRPTQQDPTAGDYRFYYNAIRFCGRR